MSYGTDVPESDKGRMGRMCLAATNPWDLAKATKMEADNPFSFSFFYVPYNISTRVGLC
jgi:hypothetical protein